ESNHKLTKRAADQNLRIRVHYDKSIYDLPAFKRDYINDTIIPKAIHYWESALLVRPLSVPIRLSRKCPDGTAYYPPQLGYSPPPHCIVKCEPITRCGEVVIPEEHLDSCRVCDLQGLNCRVLPDSRTRNSSASGVTNADFVFYVSAIQSERCSRGHTVAYAAH